MILMLNLLTIFLIQSYINDKKRHQNINTIIWDNVKKESDYYH